LILCGVKAGTVIRHARSIVAVIVLRKARRIITDKMMAAFMIARGSGLVDGIACIVPAIAYVVGKRGNRERR
jgi:hypothetical protein